MIKKLRRKLIAACMLSLAIVLTVILGGVNMTSYQKVVSDADAVLTLLGNNDGTFPKNHGEPVIRPEGKLPDDGSVEKRNFFGQKVLSPETPYESRFFSVLLDKNGQVLQTDTGQIAAVDEEDAVEYAKSAVDSGHTAGFCDD